MEKQYSDKQIIEMLFSGPKTLHISAQENKVPVCKNSITVKSAKESAEYWNYGGDPDLFLDDMSVIDVENFFSSQIKHAEEVNVNYSDEFMSEEGCCCLLIECTCPELDSNTVMQEAKGALRAFFKKYQFSNYDFAVNISVNELGYTDDAESYSPSSFASSNSANSSSFKSAMTLEELLSNVDVTTKDEQPLDDCINESAFDDECRFKSWDFKNITENKADFYWITQEDCSYGESDFIGEVVRCLAHLVKEYNYTTPFSISVLIESRDGKEYGSFKYIISFDGKTVTSAKDNAATAASAGKKFSLKKQAYLLYQWNDGYNGYFLNGKFSSEVVEISSLSSYSFYLDESEALSYIKTKIHSARANTRVILVEASYNGKPATNLAGAQASLVKGVRNLLRPVFAAYSNGDLSADAPVVCLLDNAEYTDSQGKYRRSALVAFYAKDAKSLYNSLVNSTEEPLFY